MEISAPTIYHILHNELTVTKIVECCYHIRWPMLWRSRVKWCKKSIWLKNIGTNDIHSLITGDEILLIYEYLLL